MKRVKNFLVVLSILTGTFFSFNHIEVLAEEQKRDVVKENQIIENLKEKHPNWSIVPLNTNKSKITQQSTFILSGRGAASPVTELYIDQVGSQLGTENEYYEDIASFQRTSHEVKGIVGIGVLKVGYGNDWQWLGDELITNSHSDYIIDSVGIDFNNDGIIDAFYHAVFFNSDIKIQSGTSELYKFRSTSYNSPWNMMETSINIPHE